MIDKYKVGDKVIVKSDLEIDRSYGEANFIEEMIEFLGKEATVNKVLNDVGYDLDIDKEHLFAFTDEMLED